jgi:hypothetical protein
MRESLLSGCKQKLIKVENIYSLKFPKEKRLNLSNRPEILNETLFTSSKAYQLFPQSCPCGDPISAVGWQEH